MFVPAVYANHIGNMAGNFSLQVSTEISWNFRSRPPAFRNDDISDLSIFDDVFFSMTPCYHHLDVVC